MHKKLFLISIAASLLTATAGAQTAGEKTSIKTQRGFSFGLNLGTVWNTKSIRGNTSGKRGTTAGIGLYYRFNKHWEAGITTDIKYFYDDGKISDNNYYVYGTYATTRYYPQLSTQLLVNYHFLTKKLDAYAGFSAGATTMIYNDQQGDSDIWQNAENGIVRGIHLGANYPVTRNVSLNLQVNAEALTIGTRYQRANMFMPSATAGIRFRF